MTLPIDVPAGCFCFRTDENGNITFGAINYETGDHHPLVIWTPAEFFTHLDESLLTLRAAVGNKLVGAAHHQDIAFLQGAISGADSALDSAGEFLRGLEGDL